MGMNVEEMILLISLQFGASCLIIGLMSIMNKRQSYKVDSCYGRPSPVIPVNLLDGYGNRFGYALAFGALTSLFVQSSLLGASYNYPFIFALKIILFALVYAVIGYPLFACQSTKNKAFGSVAGFLYCFCWVIRVLYLNGRLCMKLSHYFKPHIVLVILASVPEIICISILFGIFFYSIVKAIKQKSWEYAESSMKEAEQHVISYTRERLRKPQEKCDIVETPSGNYSKLMVAQRNPLKRLCKWEPEFKYSTRIVCTFSVCYIAVYVLFVAFLTASVKVESTLKAFRFSVIASWSKNSAGIVQGCLYVSTTLTTLKSCGLLFNMLLCYKKDVTRLRRGDRSFLPDSLKTHNASATSLMMGNLRYAGAQIGYTIWGFTVSFFVILLCMAAIGFLFFENVYSTFVFLILESAWPMFLIVFTLYCIQLLAAKHAFLQEREKSVALNNRNAFHIVSYFLFICNIFFGFFAGVLSSIIASVLSGIFLERIQRSSMPRSFERLDLGYNAYIGYLLVEHEHANPVMQAFALILSNEIAERVPRSTRVEEPSSGLLQSIFDYLDRPIQKDYGTYKPRPENKDWKTVRNRWQLALTLLRNPSLMKYRKPRPNAASEAVLNVHAVEAIC